MKENSAIDKEAFKRGFTFSTRIGVAATIECNRSNYLVGYGLVVGLKGTGDGKSTLFTVRSITTGKIFRLGDKVRVKVVAIDEERARLELVLV